MDQLRQHLVTLLKGGEAYETFEEAIRPFGPDQRGVMPNGAEHSAWQIVEHMRIALRDILDFSQNAEGDYVEMKWPEDYWPKTANPEPGQWEETVNAYLVARDEMTKLVRDESLDLLRPFPWGDGQTMLREALLAADHAAYHIGQLVELQRWLVAAS